MRFLRGMFACSVSTLALLALTAPAYAQSTGTQEVEKVEKVTVTGERKGTNGQIVKEQRPKTRSTVTQDYLKTQPGGQTVFQSLNLAPGVNFTNSDPYGSSGGNVRVRGFDGNRVSLTVDGTPLNDTGNYAIFTNQMVDPEYLSRATVNTGTTDVDSPTASAVGGTINLVTRKPYEDFTLTATGSAGSFDYRRIAAIIDLGEYRGVSSFAGYSFQQYDKFKGPGELQKQQGNARIYQKIGEDSFISVIGHYNENRNNFYRTLSLLNANGLLPSLPGDIPTFGTGFDNFATCTRATFGAGAQSDGSGAVTNNLANPSSCTNFYNLRINPSNTGNIRAQGSFQLSDNFRLTVDPTWQYVKANGGGTNTVSETDRRLAPGGGGVDLSGDGDTLDTVRLYTPNNTNTSRYGLTTSLIYDIDESSNVRVAYTKDYGRHRQTGAFSKLLANGDPVDIFGGLDHSNARVFGTDGSFLRGRDRISNAILDQFSASYTGRFFEDRLLVDVGLRAPFFKRELNQLCFTQLASSNVRCSTEPFTDADGDGIGTLAGGGATNYARPFDATFEYDAVLPNVGVSFEVFEGNIIYASFAEGLSAPRTDNLYFVICETCAPATPGVETAGIDTVTLPGVQPEKTKAYDVGYRIQGETVTASAALWYNEFQNRIVTSFDPVSGTNVDRNVGKVILQGVDAEIGWRPVSELGLYVSASYIDSELRNNQAANLGGTLYFPTKGKALVETPDWTFGGRIQYAPVEGLVLGFQGKYVGDRFSTDMNDQVSPSYTLFDADIAYDFTALGLENVILQFNASNLFDEEWLGNISSTLNAEPVDIDPTAAVSLRAGSTVRYQ
ncbi:MAG: TonB-dependent receptor, partial [Micropepsaceae bacterium]